MSFKKIVANAFFSNCLCCMAPLKDLYHLAGSLLVRMTLASGYASKISLKILTHVRTFLIEVFFTNLHAIINK